MDRAGRARRCTVGRLWVTGLPAPLSPLERRAIERFALVVGVELLQRKHLVEVQGRLVDGSCLPGWDLARSALLRQLDTARANAEDLAGPTADALSSIPTLRDPVCDTTPSPSAVTVTAMASSWPAPRNAPLPE